MNIRLLEIITVTAELCGTTLSEAAARIIVTDLERYPEHQVIGALAKVRHEVKGKFTLPDIVTRLDDGRPGADEAWATMPKDEADSAILTQETLKAWEIADDLHDGDKIGARFAFREAYNRLVAESRDQGKPVQWIPSMGSDPAGRLGVIEDAIHAGKISYEQALAICPTHHFQALQDAIAGHPSNAITAATHNHDNARIQAVIHHAIAGRVTRAADGNGNHISDLVS